ncbi:Ppx/GppA family phosphatase [Helicobacter cholecystus]|uniref:Ppx/GppA family phosphatase n=1 Tax=Helicobacter cholecystus TaxID=45498 RepID=A0A3D8IVK7_9HELI|nr:Ppx/GppA phosphatase family protein [Helicobacter cholecystus]RDU69040.1 Ppx/GppA family phosphatase [Helicobacter cholecystus]VEJ24569.1 exopolyphosphatase [Helicobacter cholecystus]
MAKIVAVIDIGSNSARMAIFERTSRLGFFLLEECKSRVRISEGSYENGGYLQEYPMQRTLSALKEFMQRAHQRGARKIFCVATSALRDAPNSRDFLQRARKECGIQIKIIEGEKEAYYGALACVNLSHQKSGITIDVGGGSSECALLEEGKILSMSSLDIGAIRIKELFFDGRNDISGAKEFIKKELNKLSKEYSHKYVLGIGGSIRALSKIIAKERGVNFLHGLEVEAECYIDFAYQICQSQNEVLREMGFSEDRIDSIKSGALIFCAFLEHFGCKKVITSGVGVREGVFLADLLRGSGGRFPKDFNPSFKSLLDRFEQKNSRAKEIKKQTLQIFDALSSWHKMSNKLKNSLSIASRLSLLGERLGCHSQSAHSAYLVFNGLEYGFSFNERSLIKALIEYSNKKIPKESRLKSYSFRDLRFLTSFLALAKILSYYPRVQYSSPAEGVLQIEGAGYLAREQINKILKHFDFEIIFGGKKEGFLEFPHRIAF